MYVLSSIHESTSVEIQGRHSPVKKPDCIHKYSQFIGVVDYKDLMIQPYLATRKSHHWYKNLSIYLFQLAIYNSYIIHHESTERPGSFLNYQENIFTILVYQGGSPPQTICSDVVSRLNERHFPPLEKH